MADYPVAPLESIDLYSVVQEPLLAINVPPPPPANRPANLHDVNGHYYVANSDGMGIRLRRADGYTPRSEFGTWQLDTHATSDVNDKDPALLENWRGDIVIFVENVGSIFRCSSGDRGVRWSSPVSQLPGVLPSACVGGDKQEVCIAVQPDMSLLSTVQFPGDRWPNDNHTGTTEGTSSDAPYVVVDETNTPLATDGTGTAIHCAADGRIIMAVRIGSETDLSHWWSWDKQSRTWRRVT